MINFDDIRFKNPQGTIDSLLRQSVNQAQTIHRLTEQNEGLLTVEDIDNILPNLVQSEKTVDAVKKLTKLRKDLSPTPKAKKNGSTSS